MRANVGIYDRLLRIVIGALLILFAVIQPGTNYSWLAWIGAVPLITGLIGWCPAYEVFRVSTRENSR